MDKDNGKISQLICNVRFTPESDYVGYLTSPELYLGYPANVDKAPNVP